MNPEVRAAAARDAGAVREVARATWADTYRGVIPEDAQEKFIERAYSDESLRRRMASDVFLVAVVDGEVVGFADFSPVSEGGEAELAAIYVLPPFQGSGLGTRLLRAALERMPDASRVRLLVERDNPVGRRFYEAKGFAEVGPRTQQFFGYDFAMIEMVLEVRGADRR